jgi:hypothetical protein
VAALGGSMLSGPVCVWGAKKKPTWMQPGWVSVLLEAWLLRLAHPHTGAYPQRQQRVVEGKAVMERFRFI